MMVGLEWHCGSPSCDEKVFQLSYVMTNKETGKTGCRARLRTTGSPPVHKLGPIFQGSTTPTPQEHHQLGIKCLNTLACWGAVYPQTPKST